MEINVDVSIVMLTYFHEDYVEQAIESVLSQNTVFTYELVISDDGSRDRTREILLDYKKKYPSLIKLNFNESNIGLTKNYFKARTLCTGRYLAGISGDDYWIDDKKIQYQADFLEKHQDYFAVGCSIEGRFDNEKECFAVYPKKKYRNATITLDDYLKGAMFGTNGMMIRNPFISDEGRDRFSLIPQASPYIDDATECILVLESGPIYIFENRSVVYRVQSDSNSKHNFNSIHTTLSKCKRSVELYNYLFDTFDNRIDLFFLYKDHLAVAFLQSMITMKFSEFKKLYLSIPETYRRRFLLVRMLPNIIKVGVNKIKNIYLSKHKLYLKL